MADASIAPYVHGNVDTAIELETLGDDAATFFLKALQKVAGGGNYGVGQPFFAITGLPPVFKIDHANCFIAYVVETESDGGLVVTLLYAGRTAQFASPRQLPDTWDAPAAGRAKGVIEPRLRDFVR